MDQRLNVLLLESEPGAAAIARHELEGAGHVVKYCHDPGRVEFPCNALVEGRGCPLEGEPIDVALDVRARHRARPTLGEDGVTCALRQHIPVVVAGAAELSPYDEYATEIVGQSFDVVAACERAASAPLVRHSAEAARTLREMLARREITIDPEVEVRRQHGALVITVHGAEALDASAKSMAAARMTAAVRAVDRYSRGVDVMFAE
jgi:hypothetical protein